MPFGFGKKEQTEKPEAKFEVRYVGGHKMFPKSADTKVLIFHDRLEVEKPDVKIPYSKMTNIENADESKISAMRVVLLGVIGALWKKKHVYTVIQFKDGIDQMQSMVFDFEGDIEKAQALIYQKMVASRQT